MADQIQVEQTVPLAKESVKSIALLKQKKDADAKLTVVFDKVFQEKGRTAHEILDSGTPADRGWLNGVLFDAAEAEDNEGVRDELHRAHFKLVAERLKNPQLGYLKVRSEDNVPFKFIALEALPNNYQIAKSNDNYTLELDLDSLEDEFINFCRMLRERTENPGIPLLESGDCSPQMTALIKAVQQSCFDYFGFQTETTERNNDIFYKKRKKVMLSEFMKPEGSNGAQAACTEFSLLAHEWINLTGKAASFMVSCGCLNFYPKGETTMDLQNVAHNFLVIRVAEGDKIRSFLYDPVNYEVKSHPDGYSYSWPFIEEVSNDQFAEFYRQDKPLSIKRDVGNRDYFIRG